MVRLPLLNNTTFLRWFVATLLVTVAPWLLLPAVSAIELLLRGQVGKVLPSLGFFLLPISACLLATAVIGILPAWLGWHFSGRMLLRAHGNRGLRAALLGFISMLCLLGGLFAFIKLTVELYFEPRGIDLHYDAHWLDLVLLPMIFGGPIGLVVGPAISMRMAGNQEAAGLGLPE